ncbi:hypothetical protein [Shouchella clausii]|uniref:hypothetical protein n=1 Tax=Shouchella clausii TaxID=79880 RepID=UPI000B96782E|nr:hypothetical protein [Shouchella clausii]AST96229.1 hypothetical protein BC8716_09835 [Shouchella clausii]MCR1288639.1 hypothetical protein [Shouchella clausii]MEB5473490.1 hypothetical protein [Shouchella clausii]QNM42587.1 hypothetical protein DUT88_06685 [Shouchella clausii]WQG94561.1 hypothetical protein SR921_18750 [Shouchella clausii]
MKNRISMCSIVLIASIVSGCSQSGSDEYIEVQPQKEQAPAFQYRLQIDITPPEEGSASEIMNNLAVYLQEFDLGYEVKGNRDEDRYELDLELPRTAYLRQEPVQMSVTGGLLESESLYVKTEEWIAFDNEQGTYGFMLQTTPDVENTYLELSFKDVAYTPVDVLERDEQYETLAKEAEATVNEGEIVFTVDGEQAADYFSKLIKTSLSYSFPGIVERSNDEIEKKLTIGDVEVTTQIEEGVLQRESYRIPIEEDGGTWTVDIQIDYTDLAYVGEIGEIADYEVLSKEAYNDYIVSEQQRDLEELINALN